MKVVCAWCGSRQPDKEPLENVNTSHGICQECMTKVLGEYDQHTNPGRTDEPATETTRAA